jgi:hypothetical protein
MRCSGIACGKASFWFFCRVGAPRLKTETDPVFETLCFLFVEIRTMDKVQKFNSNECLTGLFPYYIPSRDILTLIKAAPLELTGTGGGWPVDFTL